ncbi:MAG: prepilin-type N-terminal cleavage/methylation domain-containing protein, partial [Candidatus Eremiobacteraeota bacterium]|nr:prepilin-type N-terminal cleavage/methylation domain-containing protein [Candidatus Eremiobacteraeota bacterium]
MQGSQAGFSLIEILIATALFAVVAFGAFEVVRQLVVSAHLLTARHVAYASLERVTAQLRAEARSATAIWTSAPNTGSGRDDCVQVDFFTADAAGPKFWSYRNFPNHTNADAVAGDALQRLAATAPIAPCDATQAGDVVLAHLHAPLSAGTI